MSEMTPGCDCSFWQGPNVNFDVMATVADFCILRMGGGLYVDPCWLVNRRRSKGKLARGGYWYLENAVDWQVQAAIWADLYNARDDCALELPVYLDYEDRKKPIPTKPADRLWRTMTRFMALTGKWPEIYTGPDYWKNFGSAGSKWALSENLWIAHYHDAPDVPAPWGNWTLWQYSDHNGDGDKYGIPTMPGRKTDVDKDWFNGSKADLWATYGITALTPPAPKEYTEAQVTARGLNVRSGPGVNNAILRVAYKGDILMIENDQNALPWAKLFGETAFVHGDYIVAI